jgi:hypothetical protein
VASAEDDFQELSELLFGAKDRYRSARATILHTVDAAVAEESNRHFLDWRFRQPGGSGMGKLRSDEERRAHGPDVPQNFYLHYEDSEESVRLWHERPVHTIACVCAPQPTSSSSAPPTWPLAPVTGMALKSALAVAVAL